MYKTEQNMGHHHTVSPRKVPPRCPRTVWVANMGDELVLMLVSEVTGCLLTLMTQAFLSWHCGD